MISIITAVYNQLNMNRLFWEYLTKYTDNEFELIVIDNLSTDGTREFFKSLDSRVKVIENTANYSYPYCQNQGIEIAQYDNLVFLNNDLLVSPHWDSRILEVLGKNNHDIISLASNDRIKDKTTTKALLRRWKCVKYPVMAILGQSTLALKIMRVLCYGHWPRYTERIFKKYAFSTTIGFSGSAIAMNRRAIEKIGLWDPTQYGADFDTFFRTCHRHETVGDIMPLSIVNGIFVHHYRRLTLYQKYPPFADRKNLSTLEAKWDKRDIDRWMAKVDFKD